MGFFTRLVVKNAVSGYTPDEFFERYWARIGGFRNHSGVPVNEESALRFITVYSCVRVLAEALASLPLVLYRARSNGGSDKATDHPVYDLLYAQPNDEMGANTWIEQQMGNLAISGNCYSIITRNGKGQAIDVYPVPWERCWPYRDPSDWTIKYRVDDRGRYEVFPASEVFHVPGLSWDGILGYSPIRMAAESIGVAMAAAEFAARFYGQGMNAGGFLEYPNALSDKAYDRLKQDMDENWGGMHNAWRPIILEEGAKFSRLAMPMADAQFIETRKFSRDEICGLFRVPPHMIADLDRCMPADTLVYTKTGPKRIVDIKIGDEVWSVSDDGIRLSRVTNFWENGTSEVLEIRTTNRTVRCTSKHRLLVRRPVVARKAHGQRGGRNVNGTKVGVVWTNQYVAAGEIKRGDILVTLDHLPDLARTTAPNGRNLTVGFMEFCGLLLGDGNALKVSGQPVGVTIARSETAAYMDHYREVMRTEFRRYDGGNGRGDMSAVPVVPVSLVESERSTQFKSVLAASELTSLGLSGTAFTKRVPGWVFETSEELRLAFLRGFLDADGTVDAKGRITFYSANKDLINDVRHLCMGLGIPVTNVRCDRNRRRAPGSKAVVPTLMWRFTCSDPGANARIGSHDPRYIERLQAGKPFGRKNRAYPRAGGRQFSLARVTQIEHKPAEPVYDIEVEGTHCFIADGVVSHNSTNNNIEQQSLEFVMYSLLPYATKWEQAISRRLLSKRDRQQGYYAKFNLSGLLRGDYYSRQQGLALQRQNGVINANEWRALEEMNPIDGPAGTEYLVNSAMVSVATPTSGASPTKQSRTGPSRVAEGGEKN
ncbi:MAG: phage portal protein [Alicyclobacillus sp.]|nr:phage portal protein [Alicyclobacillus sp.]